MNPGAVRRTSCCLQISRAYAMRSSTATTSGRSILRSVPTVVASGASHTVIPPPRHGAARPTIPRGESGRFADAALRARRSPVLAGRLAARDPARHRAAVPAIRRAEPLLQRRLLVAEHEEVEGEE